MDVLWLRLPRASTALLGALAVQTVDSNLIVYTGFHWWHPGAVVVPIEKPSPSAAEPEPM
jgi:hypothetical protein